jgi:hypothetical protein
MKPQALTLVSSVKRAKRAATTLERKYFLIVDHCLVYETEL